jgi:hypothetical protein
MLHLILFLAAIIIAKTFLSLYNWVTSLIEDRLYYIEQYESLEKSYYKLVRKNDKRKERKELNLVKENVL